MKIYLAAPFSHKDVLREHAKVLRKAGHEVTSGWLMERINPKKDIEEGENYRKHAERDIKDINRSDLFVIFNVNPKHWIKRGGKHFEAGYAYAKGIPIEVIGPNENIFYFLRDIKHHADFDEFLAGL
jgi:nucleoside 2-deoxyribosyltransferase